MRKMNTQANDDLLKGLFRRGPDDFSFVFSAADLPPPPSDPSLPPQLTSDVPYTFARDSLLNRIPGDIIDRVLKENEEFLQQHPRSRELLLTLQHEMYKADTTLVHPIECFLRPAEAIQEESLGAPSPRTGPGCLNCGFCPECEKQDAQMWNEVLLKDALLEGTVLSKIPWILAEVYCYRRMLHAFDFFCTLHDPFSCQKLAGLASAVAASGVYGCQIVTLAELVDREKTGASKLSLSELKPHIRSAVFSSLEGNAGDLSLWPKSLSSTQTSATEKERSQPDAFSVEDPSWLLAGDFEYFFSDFCSCNSSCRNCSGCSRCSRTVHLWTDNAGEELLADLLLCSCLLVTSTAERIRLCVKQQPTYVSDATKVDVEITLRWLEERGQQDASLGKWAAMLRRWLHEGRLLVSAGFFCCSPLEIRRLPIDIRKAWETEAGLVILKGDMNYRRLLGDRAWPTETPFASVASYCCTRILALRLLKAELGCGMSKEKTSAAAVSDPKWMVDGKWGVLQYFSPFAGPAS